MTVKTLNSNDIERLADETRKKILASKDIIVLSKNPIVIRIHRDGQKFDIDLTTTI